jgi:glycosyltransferase involved in cell wall biosynthesis
MKTMAENHSRRRDQPTAPTVSVVVPVRNAGADLGGLIAALAEQTVGSDAFEVVVGDDGSTDGSIAGLPDAYAFVRVVSSGPQNSYAARNVAARAARGSVLAFTDADCRPDPGWLEAGLAALADTDVVAGAIRFVAPPCPSVWDLVDIDTFLDQERAVASGGAATANLFVRANLFERLGGFDAALPSGGDYDLVRRAVEAGSRLRYVPAAVVAHPTRGDARVLLRKLWRTQKAYGARIHDDGRSSIRRIRLTTLLPPLATARRRRRAGRTLLLDRTRLHESGITPRIRDDLIALAIIYVLIPYGKRLAHLWGLLERRRPPLSAPQSESIIIE